MESSEIELRLEDGDEREMEGERTIAVITSAPGKVILTGEHSVVYGKLAVAAAINRRCRVNLTSTLSDPSTTLPPLNQRLLRVELLSLYSQGLIPFHEWCIPLSALVISDQGMYDGWEEPETSIAAKALHAVAEVFRRVFAEPGTADVDGVVSATISIDSEVPLGKGLGSSAALCTAVAAAVVTAWGSFGANSVDDAGWRALVNEAAFAGESVLHGKPSGVDNAVSLYGGLIAFRSGEITPVAPPSPEHSNWLLVDTHVPRSTADQVAKVSRRRMSAPELMDGVLEALNGVSEELLARLRDGPGDGLSVPELVRMNQGLLVTLGVSHPALDLAVSLADQLGCAAKLTGAGGGGFAMVSLGGNKYVGRMLETKLSTTSVPGLNQTVFTCLEATIGARGVTAERFSV